MRINSVYIILLFGIAGVAAAGTEMERQKNIIETDVETRIGNEIRRYYPDLKFLISCDALLIEEEPAVDELDAKDLALPGVKGFESQKRSMRTVIAIDRLSVALLLDKYKMQGNKEFLELLENIALVGGKLSPSRGDRVRIIEMAFPEMSAPSSQHTSVAAESVGTAQKPLISQNDMIHAMTPFEGILSALLVMFIIGFVLLMRKNRMNTQLFKQEIERMQSHSEQAYRPSPKELENSAVHALPETTVTVTSASESERLKNSIIAASVGRPEIAAGAVKQMMLSADHRSKLQIILSQFGHSLLSVIRDHLTKQEHIQLTQMSTEHGSYTNDAVVDAFSLFNDQMQIKRCAIAAEEEQTPFAFLVRLSDQQLFLLVRDESPGITAMVLSQLDPVRSASILRSLQPKLQGEVAMELAVLHRLTTEAYVAVARQLAEKASKIPAINNIQVQGTDLLMDILDNVDEDEENSINDSIKTSNLELYRQIMTQRITFNDLVTVDDKIIRQIIRENPVEEIAVALKNASENIRLKFLDAVPSKSRSILLNSMEIVSQVSVIDEQAARRKLTRLVREQLRGTGRPSSERLKTGLFEPAGTLFDLKEH